MSKCLKHFKHLPVTGKEAARSPLRFSFGRTVKEEDIVESIERKQLRKLEGRKKSRRRDWKAKAEGVIVVGWKGKKLFATRRGPFIEEENHLDQPPSFCTSPTREATRMIHVPSQGPASKLWHLQTIRMGFIYEYSNKSFFEAIQNILIYGLTGGVDLVG